jgi:hypothetical protein
MSLNSKKILTTAIVVLVLSSAVLYLLPKLKLIIPIKVKYSRAGAPGVYLVPVERKVADIQENLAGQAHAGAWFSFAAPWAIEKHHLSEYAEAFVFSEERVLVVSPQKEQERIVAKLLGGEAEEARAMKRLLGEENLGSEYAAISYCLSTTPDRAGLLTPIHELSRLAPMLILKSVFSNLGDVIYRFSLRGAKGFQFGNPATAPDVYVYLFDPSDRMYRMKFSAISQEAIDYVLSTIVFPGAPAAGLPG